MRAGRTLVESVGLSSNVICAVGASCAFCGDQSDIFITHPQIRAAELGSKFPGHVSGEFDHV